MPLPDIPEQARFVGAAAARVARRGEKLSDLAVLYRAHYQALELQIELTRRGIPYEIRSGMRFFEQRHVKDVLAFLRIVVNPKDELSWKRALKIFPRIGERAASAVWEAIGEPARSARVVPRARGERGMELPRGGGRGARRRSARLMDRLESPVDPHVAGRGDPGGRRGRRTATSRARSFPTATRASTTWSSSRSSRRPTTRCRSFLEEVTLFNELSGEDVVADETDEDDRVVLSLDPPGQGPRVEPRHRDGALGRAVSRATARP